MPVTVIKAGPNVVTQVRDADTDGYAAVQIAYGEIDPRKVTKPLKGHFEKAGVTPRRHLVELRTADAADYTLGQEVTVEAFEAGQLVDVDGTTKGKGFAGVMKRHGFHGVSSSHGAHKNHRKPGSIGGAPRPAASSRACGWPAGWAACARPPRTSPSTPSTPRRACCSSRVPFPAPAAAIVLVRTAPRPRRPWRSDPDMADHRPSRPISPPRSSTCRPTSR